MGLLKPPKTAFVLCLPLPLVSHPPHKCQSRNNILFFLLCLFLLHLFHPGFFGWGATPLALMVQTLATSSCTFLSKMALSFHTFTSRVIRVTIFSSRASSARCVKTFFMTRPNSASISGCFFLQF